MSDVDAVVWVADGEMTAGLDWGARLVERLADRHMRVRRRDLTAVDDRTVPSAPLHILSGGATPVGDRSGWMAHGLAMTRDLIDRTQRRGQAVLGICLGAQMIAEELWGCAVRPRSAIQVGLSEVDWSRSNRRSIIVPSFHYESIDQARVLAGGGELMGHDREEPVQGFRYGTRVWGLQFHPELAPDDVRRLVLHHRRTIDDHGGDVDAALGSVDELERRWRSDVFDQLVDDVLTAAAVVPSSERQR